MYRQMLLLRIYDRKAVSLQRQGRFGTYAQMEGQEASLVASTYPLQPHDWMTTSYRETGAMWLHGVPLKLLSLYWMGNEFGSHMPEGVRVLPISIPVGSHPLHAVGFAYAAMYRRDGGVAITYFGDGATSEGQVHEAMNLAGVFKVPCVFFCQNNQYAISVPRHAQTASATIAQKAVAYGFPGVLVDGNDIFAVYAVTREAVARARSGKGPSLIEAYTYRLGAHTTADDPTKYRDAAELVEWQPRDPLVRVQKYLQQRGHWSEAWEQQLVAACTAEVEQAMAEAAAVPPPPPQDMFRYMYAAMTPALLEQEAALLAALQQKG
jgi:pyruvate dehydrogenase E1 component alpha subunit